jgi:CRISPR type IV-associated protein Csf3
MQTYKITFKLITPISFIDIPTLDGILSYAFAREKLKGQGFAQKLNITKEEMLDFSEMPISLHEKGYFMASRMFWDEEMAIEHTQRWRKRWANKHDKIADFGKQIRKVRINAGEFKSYDMPLRVVAIDKVWFYFKSESMPEVDRLVRKWIYFLGKKRSQGYGEISFFNIEKSDYNFNGAFRPIPTFLFDVDFTKFTKVEIKYCAWKPPYWLPENFNQCIMNFY